MIKTLSILNIEEIGISAFEGCSGLQSVACSSEIENIWSKAFSGCENLESFSFEANSRLKKIGYEAFKDCKKLVDFTIPNSVTVIETGAFWGCESLTDVTIPGGVNLIDMNTFRGCSQLRSVYIVPKSGIYLGEFTYIGAYAFADCTNLRSISVPETVTTIDEGAFANCSNLRLVQLELSNIGPQSALMSVGRKAFSNCISLESIQLNYGIEILGPNAFEGCVSLRQVGIPDTLFSVGANAFAGCSELTSIIIPEGITTLGENVFLNCNKLTIYTEHDVAPSGWSINWNAISKRPVLWSCELDISREYVISFTKRTPSITFGGISNPNAVNGISEPQREFFVFFGWYNNSNYTGEAIPAAEIANAENGTYYAKWNQPIVNFDLNGGTGEIPPQYVLSGGVDKPEDPEREGYSFKYWALSTDQSKEYDWDTPVKQAITLVAIWERLYTSGLEYVLLEDGSGYEVSIGTADQTGGIIAIAPTYNGLPVVKIADSGFSSSRISEVVIPGSIITIGEKAFKWSEVEIITFEGEISLEVIGSEAFAYCYNLNNIIIPASTKIIDTEAFYQSALESITFAGGSVLESIGDSAFAYATIGNIEIPAGVQSIHSTLRS